MVDATVSKTVGHNARAGSTPALGTSFDSNFDSIRSLIRPLSTFGGVVSRQGVTETARESYPVVRHLPQHR